MPPTRRDASLRRRGVSQIRAGQAQDQRQRIPSPIDEAASRFEAAATALAEGVMGDWSLEEAALASLRLIDAGLRWLVRVER